MTKITQIDDKSAATAWSPIRSCADVIALGTKDSGGIGFDDTGGSLDLYDLNLSSGGGEKEQPVLLGSVKTESRFSSVGWSSATLGGKYPMGLLAGGMENGAVHVWNVEALVSKKNVPPSSVVASFTQHASGPVKALQFNPLNPTQLATGGSDGKVLIVDLEQPDYVYMPCANNSQQNAQITSLAWNTQVAHILASAAADGTVSIWDLKSKKAWCELRSETAGMAVADVAWNPTQGLFLLTASADDRNPVIKLWDLRSSTSMPLATLAGHTKGILSMAWCPHDDQLLLSCGKDNRTILWDLFTLQPIADVPNDSAVEQQQVDNTSNQEMFAAGGLASSQQRRYDVQWSPIKRGVALTCSLDRKVQAHSILGLSSKSGRPPKWMRPSSSVSCGFGGAVVSCGSTDRYIRMKTFVEEPELESLSRNFEYVIESTNAVDFCNERVRTASDADEAQLWEFMQVIFDPNARQQLLGLLGFDPEKIAEKAVSYKDELANEVENMSMNDSLKDMSKGTEEIVKRALLVGNFEAAVECCFQTGNLADALVLASCGGAELWSKTQQRYFGLQSAKRSFLPVVNAVMRQELGDLIQNSDVTKWKETLAILSTYAQAEEFPTLCVALGDLLEKAGDDRSASLCFMCSLSLDRAGKFWRQQLEEVNKQKGSLDLAALHEYVVKVSVFSKAVGSSAVLGAEDSELFSKYATKLAEQGLFATAAKYSRAVSQESKELQDRLYRSKASQNCLAAMGGVAPEFPFTLSDVKKSRVPTQQRQPTSNQGASQYMNGGHSAQSSNGYSNQAYTQDTQQNGTHASSSSRQPAQSTMSASEALPEGWVALQDPASGMTYYANQNTGEVTWDKPQVTPEPTPVSAPVPAPQPAEQVQSSVPATPNGKKNKLVAKYGDGFVTSASHPELASQYGNVGTSNPYHGTARPGTAAVASQPDKAPISGTLEPDRIPELQPEHQPVKDCFLGVIDALKSCQLSSVDKRLLAESEKGVAVLLKRLALGDVSTDISEKVLQMTGFITSYEFGTAQSTLTELVNHEWRDHKDWLKGIKALLQLSRKTWNR